MSRPLPWLWIALALIVLLLPMPAGRFLLDLLGGLTLTLLLLPVLLGAAGWIGWQILRSRLRSCTVCGVTSFSQQICPACGSSLQDDGVKAAGHPTTAQELDVSQMTINVDAIEVPGPDSSANSRPQG